LARAGGSHRAGGSRRRRSGRPYGGRTTAIAKAVEIHRRYQVPFDQAETLHCWGRALLAAGDREAARGKLNAAMEPYRRHEAGERWLEKMQTDHLRAQVPSVACAQPALGLPETGTEKRPGEDSQLTGTFRQHGEYWTLSLAGSESRLRDRKGFHYIAWLLRHPDQEFAAWDLVANVEPGSLPAADPGPIATHQGNTTITSGLGDAGAVLDASAKAQYKRRLTDLREELELAGRANDPGRLSKATDEIEFIQAEVSSALGLGGRDRKSSSHAERARLAITKTVKAALDRIRDADPELGRHLAVSIRTGNFCAYVPKQRIDWHL